MPKPNPTQSFFRLTLSAEAYRLVIERKSVALAGDSVVVVRGPNKIDVFVKPAVANLLRQLGEPKENLSDVVVRVLKKETA